MRTTTLIILAVLIASCTTQQSKKDPTFVKTEWGWVHGKSARDTSVLTFQGIPFAAPPVGDLRWKAPQPHQPWTDTLACTQFGASPIQGKPVPFLMWSEEFISPPEPLSEDCLFLNVWTPAKTDKKLPVFVWIHGGGFVSGSGACAVYDGEAYAKAGIVFVSINYRQGVFGFMAHPELSAETKTKSSGNYGVLDQVAALQWVQKNISAFGGDPAQVTIAGQSAGSIAVHSLVASPLAKGLFIRAIAQSGGLSSARTKTLAEGAQTGIFLSKKINGGIAALRALPADSVFALANTIPSAGFSPIVDGYYLPEGPQAIFDGHKQNDVAFMAGWITGDGGLVLQHAKTAAQFKEYAQATYKDRSAEFLKLFSASTDSIALRSQQELGILQFAGVPYYQWALSNSSKGYIYEDSYVPTDKPGFPNYGAFHTSDVPFALHTLSQWDRPWKESDKKVEEYMSSYWINFIKTGDPNGTGLPVWPAYDKTSGTMMELSTEPMAKPGLLKDQLEFLSVVPK